MGAEHTVNSVLDGTILCRACGRGFRGITHTHLVRRHGYDPEHPLLEYRGRYHVRGFLCRQSQEKKIEHIRRAADRRRKWTRQTVVAEIRRRDRAGEPLNSWSATRRRGIPCRVIQAYFGSWEAAVRAAGIRREVRRQLRWGRARVLAELRRRRRAGESLTQSVVMRRDPRLFGIATYYYRTWRRALAAAGIRSVKDIFKHGRWSRSTIVAEIRRRFRAGRSLTTARVMEDDSPLCRAALYHIGSWSRAVDAAGFDYATFRHKQGSKRPTQKARPACRCCRIQTARGEDR